MADLLFPANLAANIDFIRRVQSALVSAAINVQSEGVGVVNHVARKVFASKVLANPFGYAVQAAPAVAANPTVQGDYTPGSFTVIGTESNAGNNVQFQANSVFDALS